MALQGKFIVNNQPFSPLIIYGVGAFQAFSGNNIYRNRGGCTAIPDNGPIPAGKYWIVDRRAGGIRSQVQAWGKDLANTLIGNPSDHNEWFALYRDDGRIDDDTWINGIKRSNFRLHPVGGSGVSFGCITLQSRADFQRLRSALLHTAAVTAGDSGIRAYGWIEVIANGDTCP
jgi:hypothetical protein